jgi:galactokinase
VLPAAINKYVCFAISSNGTNTVNLFAKDLNESYSFDLTQPLKPGDLMWANFSWGWHTLLKKKVWPFGVNVVFSSTIPMGAGLSSSAAVEWFCLCLK